MVKATEVSTNPESSEYSFPDIRYITFTQSLGELVLPTPQNYPAVHLLRFQFSIPRVDYLSVNVKRKATISSIS